MSNSASFPALTRVSLALSGLVLLAIVPSAIAQPSGSITFSGAGAALLPSETFVPHLYAGDESSWSFFDETETVGIVVIELSANPSLASFVSVTVDGGATWLQIGFTGVAGVSIGGDTITFTDVLLPQSGFAEGADITMNGSLTRSTIAVSNLSWGSVKARFKSD